jgi:hypothetical protein
VAEMYDDVCERCGAFASGHERWMLHSHELPAKQFFCFRCLRVMRIYAIVGFSLLGLLMFGFVATLWWLGVF